MNGLKPQEGQGLSIIHVIPSEAMNLKALTMTGLVLTQRIQTLHSVRGDNGEPQASRPFSLTLILAPL